MKEKEYSTIGGILITILVALSIPMVISFYETRLDYGFSLYYIVNLATYTIVIFYPVLKFWSDKIIKWCNKDK